MNLARVTRCLAVGCVLAAGKGLIGVDGARANSCTAAASRQGKSVLSAIKEVWRGWLDAVLPQTCAACGVWLPGGSVLICEACRLQITADSALPYCWRCGRTLPSAALHEEGCARCRLERHWNVAGVGRVGRYLPALRSLLLGLKYRGRERNAEFLADCLAEVLRRRGWLIELDGLVPVPMHWLRRLQRPCDHAAVLASALSERIGVPVVRLVRRSKHTPSQTTVAAKAARFANVRGCFALPRWYQPPWPKRDLRGRTMCIVDNLMVTGATVHEVAKVLRRAGAKRIYAVVVARPAAPGDPPTAWDPLASGTSVVQPGVFSGAE